MGVGRPGQAAPGTRLRERGSGNETVPSGLESMPRRRHVAPERSHRGRIPADGRSARPREPRAHRPSGRVLGRARNGAKIRGVLAAARSGCGEGKAALASVSEEGQAWSPGWGVTPSHRPSLQILTRKRTCYLLVPKFLGKQTPVFSRDLLERQLHAGRPQGLRLCVLICFAF